MGTLGKDPRFALADQKLIRDILDRLEIGRTLKRAGVELVGPCPECGGRDRFSVHLAKNVFYCRTCQAKGGALALVRLVLRCDWGAALDWLCGAARELTDAERAALEKTAEENREKQRAEAENYRRAAIADARTVWQRGLPAEGTPVRDYLTRRGIRPALFPRLPPALRYLPDCAYMVQDKGRAYREVHRGPAMLAAIQGPDGRFCGVHRTWIDLSQPKAKAMIVDPQSGEVLPAKKTLGAKKGGAIRLREGNIKVPQRLIMGEGIETTLSAAIADQSFSVVWCGIDLGNMSGQMMHGRGQKYLGIPDMTDEEAFVPPPWVRELIYVQDGDSDPRMTRARMLAGCRRAMKLRPGLTARVVRVPEGMDLNDVLMGAGEADE